MFSRTKSYLGPTVPKPIQLPPPPMLSLTLYEEQYITFDIPPSDKPQTVKVIFKKHKSARIAQLVIDAPDRIRILRPKHSPSCPTSNCPPPDASLDSPSLPSPNIES